MTILYEEALKRFPEIRSRFREGDEEPYIVMMHLTHWLQRLPADSFTPDLVERLVSFAKWCEKQPRGKDAGDDLLTILVVGFYEELFDSETTRALLPKFITRQEFIGNADYLRTWVGEDNYDKARKYYEPEK